MNDKNFNILWLDDYFIDSSEVTDKSLKESIEIFQGDVDKAGMRGWNITGISTYEQFLNQMDNISSYDALILDLMGMTKEDEITPTVPMEVMDLLKGKHPIRIYIYSANIENVLFRLLIHKLDKAGRCFQKGAGVKKLIEKVESDLKRSYQFYEGYEDCLELLNKGYLNPSNRGYMNRIMKGAHHMEDDSYEPYNDIRHILEDMVNYLWKSEFINHQYFKKEKKQENFNSKINYITIWTIGPEKEPLVSDKKISVNVKYLLNYLSNISNGKSHFLNDDPGYVYNVLTKKATYPAFHAVMKWYLNLRENERK